VAAHPEVGDAHSPEAGRQSRIRAGGEALPRRRGLRCMEGIRVGGPRVNGHARDEGASAPGVVPLATGLGSRPPQLALRPGRTTRRRCQQPRALPAARCRRNAAGSGDRARGRSGDRAQLRGQRDLDVRLSACAVAVPQVQRDRPRRPGGQCRRGEGARRARPVLPGGEPRGYLHRARHQPHRQHHVDMEREAPWSR
jgi:hypothetical protein